jgi:tRNA (adenine37-N6)-methyltransferase
MFTLEPIGYFHSSSSALYDVPRQSAILSGNEGVIQLKRGCQFEQALEGLEGFDRIWILFCFHRHSHWKPKVLPPRSRKKQGVFATRSPHRPNFIGFSCVELKSIKGLQLLIANHDLIDGTPILDLKPYLNYADAFSCARQGWLDDLPPDPAITFQWSPLAQQQIDYLANFCNCPLKDAIEFRLSQSPFPSPHNRIKRLEENCYRLSYRTWRVHYSWEDGLVIIGHLESGYDTETLSGRKHSKWLDVSIHQTFIDHFEIHKPKSNIN